MVFMDTISQINTSVLQISDTPYFIEDRFLNVYYPMRKILPMAFARSFIDLFAKKVMNSLFPGAMFFTTIRFVESLYYCRAVFSTGNDEEKTVLLSPETIENGTALQKKKTIPENGKVLITSLDDIFYPEKNAPPTKQRYYYVLARIKKIAKMMGLSNSIQCFMHPKGSASILTTSTFSLSPVCIYINHRLLKEADSVVDFTIAHELAHLKNNDILGDLLFNNVVWIVGVGCLMHCPLLIFLVEIVASVIENFFLCRKTEKDADFLAMNTLATNRGAINFFGNRIKQNSSIKRIEIPKTWKNPHLVKWLEKMKDSLTPEGNLREDLKHPPLTERLAYARAFVPQKISGDRRGRQRSFAHQKA